MNKTLIAMKQMARAFTHLAAAALFMLLAVQAHAQTPTTTGMWTTLNPALAGRPFELVARVYPEAATGTVVFKKQGTTVIGSAPLVNGVARLTVTLPSATYFTAHYSGSGTYAASASQVITLQNVLASSPLPAPAASPTTVVTFGYDAQGNPTQSAVAPNAPGLNLATTTAYDGLGRPTSQTNPANGTIQLSYDALNGLSSVTDPRGLVTSSPRDVWNQVLQLQSPDTGTATQTSDNAGNLSTRTDSRGVLASYTYDALDRLTAISYSKAGQPTQSLQWTYDQTGAGFSNGIGRLTTASFPEGSTRYSYDAQGRDTTMVQTVNATPGANIVPLTHTVGYGYTAAGRLSSVTYPSGRQVQITYTDGLPSSVSVLGSGGTSQPLMTNLQYSPFGPLQSWNWVMATGNLAHARTFDASGRLQRYPMGPYLRENTYDEAGRVSGIMSFLVASDGTSGALVPGQTRGYAYDRAGRLITVLDSTGAMARSYAYDANGNRTVSRASPTSNTTTFAIDPASNRVLYDTWPVQGFSYDAAGNMTADVNFTLGYDLRGRLSTSSVLGTTHTYTYDNAGQRVRKVSSVGAGSTIIFVYDQSNQLLGEYDANGNVMREYVWLDDQPVAMLAPDSANPGVAQVFFVHTDHLNTPRALVDMDNRLRWKWTGLEDAFGREMASMDPPQMPAVTFNLRFPGQIYDSESGTHYNFNRQYAPSLGRYTQSDLIGLAGGINTYSYVDGNPLSFADPEGLVRIPGNPRDWIPLEGGGGGGGGSARPSPNPWGSKGGPAHTDTIQRRLEELKTQGYQPRAGGKLPEEVILTPGGSKTCRRPDITTIAPDGSIYRENVGRSTRGGDPIARERRALDDIEAATGSRPGYTPYDR